MKRFLLLWLGISVGYSVLLFVLVLRFPHSFKLPALPLMGLYLLSLLAQFPLYYVAARRLLGLRTAYGQAVPPALFACFATGGVPVILAIVLVTVGCGLFPQECHMNLMPR